MNIRNQSQPITALDLRTAAQALYAQSTALRLMTNHLQTDKVQYEAGVYRRRTYEFCRAASAYDILGDRFMAEADKMEPKAEGESP